MKPIILTIFTLLFIQNGYTQTPADINPQFTRKKILIVYYSRSGNTENVAQKIQKQIGGDLFEIQTQKPYPKNYEEHKTKIHKEIANNYKPKLKNKISNLKDYDIIFLGSPCWWNTIPPGIVSFLSENNLSDKTIIPFIAPYGSILGNTLNAIKKLVPKVTITNAKAFKGSWFKTRSFSRKK